MPASRLEVRPAPAVVSTGVAALDTLTGGLPRGALTEILGPASSGRTSLLVSVLATMTAHGEVCALVDTSDRFSPEAAQSAGVDLDRMLWVRCNDVSRCTCPVPRGSHQRAVLSEMRNMKRGTWGRLEQALKATDLLLQSGGFGMVVVDLGDIEPQAARRVPLTSWFRFRRAVENTATVLLALVRESCAKTCASLVLQLSAVSHQVSSAGSRPSVIGQRRSSAERVCLPSHAEILSGVSVHAEVLRSRTERKPVRSVTAEFDTRSQWA